LIRFHERKSVTLCLASAFVLLLGISSASSQASTSDRIHQGRMLAQKIDERDIDYQDFRASLIMTISKKNGSSITRKLIINLLEVDGDGDKSLIVFDFPADIRGTKLLTHSKFRENDDQWLYLPSINRVKRISTRNKSGAFVGSEFSFEDLSDKSVDDFDYEHLGEVVCSFTIVDIKTKSKIPMSGQCEKLARVPHDKHSGYSKQVLLVDKQAQRILQIDYFDVKGAFLKQMISKNFSLYESRYWRPQQITMTNQQSGKSTVLKYETLSFRNNLKESDFRRSKLSR